MHHIGALRDHLPVNYKKAKQGWLCIKAKIEGERDYYVNGTTGETSYEKPVGTSTTKRHTHLFLKYHRFILLFLQS